MICETRRTWSYKATKETWRKYYKILAIPFLLVGSEPWIVRKVDERRRVESAEIKFLWSVKDAQDKTEFQIKKLDLGWIYTQSKRKWTSVNRSGCNIQI
jgi:hypothetical protein